jgi:hypothetical protein
MPTQSLPELDAILSDLHAAVHAEVAAAGAPRRRSPRGRFTLAAPFAAAVAVAAAIFVGLGVGNEQPAAAAQQLRHAAQLVAADPAPVIGPGQYWYVKGLGAFANEVGGADGERFSALQTSSHEIWIASDASGRILRKDGPPHFFSSAARARWEAAGKPAFGDNRVLDELEPAGELSWGIEPLAHAVFDLPSDAATLAQLLERNSDAPYEEFALIEEVLRFAPLSGAQTAAFYQVLASLPGIEIAGEANDGLGRTGTAFAIDNGSGLRQELILDPGTGRLLGSRETLTAPDPVNPDTPVGTVLGSETIIATGVVDSTDARPQG